MDEYRVNPNYKFLFQDKDMEANEINNQINKIIMASNFDCEVIKRKIKEQYGEEFFEITYLGDLIDNLLDKGINKNDIYREMHSLGCVKAIFKIGEEKYKIETTEGELIFSSIQSYFFNNEERKFKNMDEVREYTKQIESIKTRNGHCHKLAQQFGKIFFDNFDMGIDVVTGYTSHYTNPNKYLHSWNEIKVNDEEYVIDSTLNVVMNKNGYYLINHTGESQIVSRIKMEDIIKDNMKYGELLKEIDSKTYLTSRDETIRDLGKNKHLFSDGEER